MPENPYNAFQSHVKDQLIDICFLNQLLSPDHVLERQHLINVQSMAVPFPDNSDHNELKGKYILTINLILSSNQHFYKNFFFPAKFYR